MNQPVVIPVGWNWLLGEPAHEVRFEWPPNEILLSNTMIERQMRVWQPLRVMVDLAVSRAMKAIHDGAEARYHAARPAHKVCPFDPACRFV
jgi:hypothetical protein